MKLFKEGLTAGDLITELRKYPEDIPLFVASDEEKNTIYKGIYVERLDQGDNCIILAGLTGCEVDEEEQICTSCSKTIFGCETCSRLFKDADKIFCAKSKHYHAGCKPEVAE